MINKINLIVDNIFEKIISWRKKIHSNPELSFKEFETSNFIIDTLKTIGVTDIKKIGPTGLVALIRGKNPNSKCIAVRAELDALPIIEDNLIEYKSKNHGVMHACGHDVHMSCLLGTAYVLNELKLSFSGTVKLIFQPAEELLPGGASIMIKNGILSNPKIDEIYALHVFPSLNVGKVGLRSGIYMSACDELFLKVIGKGGHAALPNQYINPINIISELLIELQKFVHKLSNNSKYIFVFGKIFSDGSTNIIPSEVNAMGTFRTLDENWRNDLHNKIKSFVKNFLISKNAEGEIIIKKGYPVLINDEKLTQNSINLFKKIIGNENVVKIPIRMTSDDFAYYCHRVPSCYFRIGVRNEKKGIIHGVHNSRFNIDDDALKVGTKLMSNLVFKSLN
ncbi:MAG: N-acyl-L-amino acid amidohydrolase [Flavobacteriales bacterium]|nr:N-acyl-L-amino acid amidohydrolase [Flavobacteriales bacterium]|tara:strand:- start:8 stop:1186 length:1179 start_codon:yes stop_codon:yes gene_type:complete